MANNRRGDDPPRPPERRESDLDRKLHWLCDVGTPEPLSDLPCGDISPLGITSTMVYDPATNRVFAVAEPTGGAHTLVGINATTGTVEVRVPVEPPLGDPPAVLM